MWLWLGPLQWCILLCTYSFADYVMLADNRLHTELTRLGQPDSLYDMFGRFCQVATPPDSHVV